MSVAPSRPDGDPGASLGELLLLGCPRPFLRELARRSGGDVLTVYLSDPAATFERSSYLLIGGHGIDPGYLPYMKGPLAPASVALFSAADREPTLVLSDASARPEFARSRFNAHHGIRSLVRLSVRLASGIASREPGPRAIRLPPFVEVFVGYRASRPEDWLRERADAVREWLVAHAKSLREATEIRRLLNLRALARKARRIDEIASRCAEDWDIHATSGELRRRVRDAFKQLARFVHDIACLPERDSTIGFIQIQDWEDSGLEAILLAASPDGRFDAMKQALIARAKDALALRAAAAASSIVLEGASRNGEEGSFLVHPGLSLSYPLFAGRKVVAVMTIESERRELPARSLPTLNRVLPQIERLVRDLITRNGHADMVAVRQTIRELDTYALAPKETAVGKRLDVIGSFLAASECTFAEWDNDQPFLLHWHRAAGAPNPGPRPIDRAATHHFTHEPQVCLLHLRHTPGAAPGVFAFRLTRESGRRVHRERLEPSAAQRILGRHLADVAAAPAIRDEIILPLWQVWTGDPRDRDVRGLLIVARQHARFTLTPLRVENLHAVAKSFALSVFSIASLAQKDALYAWATAGIGPVHDLLHVAALCADGVQRLEGDPATIRETAQRVMVIREQLWIWHLFSQPGIRLYMGEERVTLEALVEGVLDRALLLTGSGRRPAVRIPEADRAHPVAVGVSGGVTAVLTNVVANSVKWGRGIERLDAGVDHATGDVTISISNRADRGRLEEHLREAVAIARDIREGRTVEAFDVLAAQRQLRGMRGIGTWLAGRVTRDLLGGSYALRYEPAADDAGSLDVIATVTFPTRESTSKVSDPVSGSAAADGLEQAE